MKNPSVSPFLFSPLLYIGYRCDMVCWGGLPPPTWTHLRPRSTHHAPRSYRRTSKVSWSKDQEGLPESRRIPERGQRPSWLSAQRSDFSRLTVALRSGDIQSGEETTPSICSLRHLLKGPDSQAGTQRCFAAKGQQCSELNP
jgi:hypothetical protein